jgi:DNA mismatch endonuclease (patch repair protein)
MQAIKNRNTRPEMAVRALLHAAGYRYRLHVSELPGRPDIVFSARRKIIEIRGCFWHGHNCRVAHTPVTRESYWGPKVTKNRERDQRNLVALRVAGWEVLEVWECRIRVGGDLLAELTDFLGPPSASEANSTDQRLAHDRSS